jgi:hypothetical protein
MIHRTFDPTIFNTLANLPDIRETFQHHQPIGTTLDFTSLIDDPHNIFLTNGIDACAYYIRTSPVSLDGHSIAAPSIRGKLAVAIGKACLEWLWQNTDASIITGSTPVELRAARLFNRLIGLKSIGLTPVYGALAPHMVEQFYIQRPLINIG